jgi:hypothetical protein
MTKIYLINKQDRYCPENNNGDYFIEAWSTEKLAYKRASELDKEDGSSLYLVHEFYVDMTEEKAMEAKYRPREKADI